MLNDLHLKNSTEVLRKLESEIQGERVLINIFRFVHELFESE
jgi:hypothetical protein